MTGVTTTRGGGGGGGAFLPHPAVAAAAAAAQSMLRPRTSSRFIPRLLDIESERWGCPGRRDPPPDRSIAQIFKPRGSPASSPGRRKDRRPRRMLAQTARAGVAFQRRVPAAASFYW